MTYQSQPILRKAIEPACPGDLAKLSRGLALLYKADPFVQIESNKEGEHILCAAGEGACGERARVAKRARSAEQRGWLASDTLTHPPIDPSMHPPFVIFPSSISQQQTIIYHPPYKGMFI